ncbi:hypothetical protein GCM10027037_11880 [Mucilaginibacter koreensis]
MAKSKTLIVDQCYFGEKDRGHGLLSATFNDRELSAYLSRISDLPISKPADIQPEPFYGCHRYDIYLIFTKTLIDKFGSRPGMVFTHALIVSSADAEQILDLNQVFDFFIREIPAKGNYELYQTEIELTNSLGEGKEEPDGELLSIVNFLLTKKADQVCVLGLNSNVPTMFVKLWNVMVPKLRYLLTFRLAFTHADIHPDQYQIYFTPDSLLQKWPNESRAENYAVPFSDASLAIKLMVNSPDAINLQTFINEINFRPIDFDKFMLCELAFKSYKQIDTLSESKILQLIRLLTRLSPSQSDGKDIKRNILLKLKAIFSRKLSESTLLLSFSNINIAALNDTDEIISSQISKHISDWWQSSNLDLIQEVLCRRLEEENIPWWTSSVDSTFHVLLKSIDDNHGRLIWALWSKIELSLDYVIKYVQQVKNIERILVQTMPQQVSVGLKKKIADYSKNNKWFLLHAKLIVSYLSPVKALQEQLKLTTNDKTSLATVAEVFEPIEFIKFAVDGANTTLLAMAVNVPLTNTQLLSSLNIETLNWQDFVGLKIKQLLSKTKRIDEFKPLIQKIWDRLSAGSPVSEDLMITLSISDFSDLSWYKNRETLWTKIPIGIKNRFLISTGTSILNQLPSAIAIESNLKDALIALDIVGKYMSVNSGNWSRILNVFDYLNNLPQKYLSDHLNFSQHDIPVADAKRLGKLVYIKNWENCANIIYEKAKYHSGFKIALGQCGELLGFWRRLKINFTYTDIPRSKNVSQSDWLKHFEEFCNEIYQEDSDIRYVWKRAGGDVSELKSKESAREIWHHAIGKLENGKMHNLTFRLLLNQMANDNPAKRYKLNMLLNSLNELPNLT